MLIITALKILNGSPFNGRAGMERILERGGTAYLTAYLQGAAHTMDTALMSSQVKLSKERAKELLAYFYVKMENPANAEEAKLYGDYFRDRFERYAK